VILYFIVRVEVVEIQICFEFKLIYNLQNRFEKEKILNWKLASGRIRRSPDGHRARPSRRHRGPVDHGRETRVAKPNPTH
jgi:hypothetical protein